jgi:hypothetical protein
MTSLRVGPGEGLSRYSRERKAQPRRWWYPRTATGRRCCSRYLPSGAALVCDKQHLVADRLDHLTVVAHHGTGGVLLEGFPQGGQVRG